MPITFTGSKTVTTAVAPHLSAATLTALMAIAPENLTVAQLHQIQEAIGRVEGGGAPDSTIGALLV